MSLCLDKSEEANFLRFCARFCGVKTSSAASGEIRLRVGNTVLQESNTIIRYFARAADREVELLGVDAFEKASIAQALSIASDARRNGNLDLILRTLNQELTTKTYLVGNRVTLADAVFFWVVYYAFASKKQNPTKFSNISRWLDQIQNTVGVRGFADIQLLDLKAQDHVLMA